MDKRNRMIIGVSGYSGSGKTVFSNHLSRYTGFPRLDADSCAFEFISSHKEIKNRIREVFGAGMFSGRNLLRRELGRKVFLDTDNLIAYNQIVQPYIETFFSDKLRHVNRDSIFDAALIPYWNIESLFDILVWMESSREKRITRCAAKRDIPFDEVERRIDMQTALFSKPDKVQWRYVYNESSEEELVDSAQELGKEVLKNSERLHA